MLHHVAFVRTDISKAHIASIIRVKIFNEIIEAMRFSETSVLTRAIRHNIPEDGILFVRKSGSGRVDAVLNTKQRYTEYKKQLNISA
jgi:hypothetical protein